VRERSIRILPNKDRTICKTREKGLILNSNGIIKTKESKSKN